MRGFSCYICSVANHKHRENRNINLIALKWCKNHEEEEEKEKVGYSYMTWDFSALRLYLSPSFPSLSTSKNTKLCF